MPEKLSASPDSFKSAPNFHGEVWHTMEGRAIREIIFGLNDGLITAFCFVAGVSSAHVLPVIVFLTGLAQAAAGAISMFFGGYLSSKAQREFFHREIERERYEIENEPQKETDEIREIYEARGFSKDEIEILVRRITSDKQKWLEFMVREELGLAPERFDQPVKVAVIIGLSFLVGGLLPVLPYAFLHEGHAAILTSTLITLIALFAVGAIKTKLTKTSWFSNGLESLTIGVIAGGIGFGVGKLLALFNLASF
jgi:VIT1/CCC1 family predicted Fe2+/Mn2+ transporter